MGSPLTYVDSRLLLQNPHVFEILRREVNTVAGHDKAITRAHIQRMPYLQSILKESKGFKVGPFPHMLKSEFSTSTVPASTNQHPLL